MDPNTEVFESRLFYEERRYESDLRGSLLDAYLEHGWYPMQQSVFTITHHALSRYDELYKAWWLRYKVDALKPHRSHTELRRKNRFLETELQIPFQHSVATDILYQTYLDGIDFYGYVSVANATFAPDQENVFDTGAFYLREKGCLVACGIFHLGDDSVASILHFHDHAHNRLSLGRYLMLLTTDWMRQTGRSWYYPGYLLAGLPKFDYKLFLGREEAQVFNPRSLAQADVSLPLDLLPNPWVPFRESFRTTPVLHVLDVMKAHLSRKQTDEEPKMG